MKVVLGESGITLDIVKDDLSCVDTIEQTLGAAGREVRSFSCLLFSLLC